MSETTCAERVASQSVVDVQEMAKAVGIEVMTNARQAEEDEAGGVLSIVVFCGRTLRGVGSDGYGGCGGSEDETGAKIHPRSL